VTRCQEYIQEVVDQLLYLADNSFTTFPLMQKLVFFRETRHSFGRTALMLSGGPSHNRWLDDQSAMCSVACISFAIAVSAQ
jgi:hypothetical protein